MFTLPSIVENYLESLGPNNIVGVVCNSYNCIVANAYKNAHRTWRYVNFDDMGLHYADEEGILQHLPADPEMLTIMELFDFSGEGGDVKAKHDWEQDLERAVWSELSEFFETVRSVITPLPKIDYQEDWSVCH